MRIDLKRDADSPLYRQIHASISRSIRSGGLPKGTRLPSVRAMSKELGVSLITIVQAYDALTADGLIHATVGRGTFVGSPSIVHLGSDLSEETARTPESPGEGEWQTSLPVYLRSPRISEMESRLKSARRPDVIYLASGTPDSTLFPVRAIGRIWHRAMVVEDPRYLQYGSPQGDANLRTWIAGHCSSLGIEARPEDILITSGVQQAIDLVARTFVGPGDYVLVESPTFLTALDIFDGRGVKLMGVPVDARGMKLDVAAMLVGRFHPRMIYTIPTAQNPTGTTMNEERRRRLAELARQHNILVLEDDSCSEFTYDSEAPPSIKAFDSGGHVIFVKGFSKTVVPGLRVGGVVAHGSIMSRLAESKAVADRFSSTLVQRTLWRYLSSRQYERDLEMARGVYRGRRDAMLRALETYMPQDFTWTHPDAGFNLWVNLPKSISSPDAFEEGMKEGVACGPGDLFLPHVPPPSGLRLSFADKPEHIIAEGVRRLASAMLRLKDQEATRSQETEFVTTI